MGRSVKRVALVLLLSVLAAPATAQAWVRVETCDAACEAEPVEGESEPAELCGAECEGDVEDSVEASPCDAACEAAEPSMQGEEASEPVRQAVPVVVAPHTTRVQRARKHRVHHRRSHKHVRHGKGHR